MRKQQTKGSSMNKSKPLTDKLSRVLYFAVMLSFIFAIIYVPARAILDEEYRSNTEYRIMIFQTLFGLAVVNLPSFLRKRFMWKIPGLFSLIFTAFLWGAIFAGEVWEFYYRFELWDDILHLMSSMMAAMLGFSLIDILNNDEKHSAVRLSPFFVALFSVCFAVMIGVLWELYEFTLDGILGMNMQKFAEISKDDNEFFKELSGRDALMDTMTDLTVDTLGAIIISSIGYISLKRRNGWLKAFKVDVRSVSD